MRQSSGRRTVDARVQVQCPLSPSLPTSGPWSMAIRDVAACFSCGLIFHLKLIMLMSLYVICDICNEWSVKMLKLVDSCHVSSIIVMNVVPFTHEWST